MHVIRGGGLTVVMVLALAGPGNAASDSRLVQAAEDRDSASVRALLAEGADIDVTQPDGTTALHWAAHWDDYDTADLLIGRDPVFALVLHEPGVVRLLIYTPDSRDPEEPMIDDEGQAPAHANLALDWSAADEAPILPANTFWVQTLGSDAIVTFGHAAPPAETSGMDASQMETYLEENRVKVRQVVRVLLSRHAAERLAEYLKANQT